MILNRRGRLGKATSYLYMFPYYFNISFWYFRFIPVFGFRFRKSRYPINYDLI